MSDALDEVDANGAPGHTKTKTVCHWLRLLGGSTP
jgi:hypothetical protein